VAEEVRVVAKLVVVMAKVVVAMEVVAMEGMEGTWTKLWRGAAKAKVTRAEAAETEGTARAVTRAMVTMGAAEMVLVAKVVARRAVAALGEVAWVEAETGRERMVEADKVAAD